MNKATALKYDIEGFKAWEEEYEYWVGYYSSLLPVSEEQEVRVLAALFTVMKWLPTNAKRGVGRCGFCWLQSRHGCYHCGDCLWAKHNNGQRCNSDSASFRIWASQGKTDDQADAVLEVALRIYNAEHAKLMELRSGRV